MMSQAADSSTRKDPCYPDLRDKVALVTGGGTGIGRAIAQRLAAEGMKVAICGRRREPLEETVRLIEDARGKALCVPTDVGNPDDVQNLLDHVTDRSGPVEALVHNAMLMSFPTFEEYTLERWEASFATGTRGAYLLSQRVVLGMRERGCGGIVLISSVLAQRPNRRGAAYAAVKGALEAMARQMALSFARDGVRVNAVAPGLISSRGSTGGAPQAHDAIPMGRAGAPAEIAAVVAFLLSGQSSYITGQVLHADGGTSVQLAPPGVRL
jgi:NAD(P)-dependent dehydrogenase (short-subunit alcohol dehydrogenase family)